MRLVRGCLARLFLVLLCGAAVMYAVIAVSGPWAFHIGGRFTPLLYWHGAGKLKNKDGAEYPLYVLFYPAKPSPAAAPREGLRATGDVQGTAAICTGPGVTQRLRLTGMIYGAWKTTEGSVMDFRLLEPKVFDTGQQQGFFDLAGRWHGGELAMTHPGATGNQFRSGLRIEGATATLKWDSYADFKAACASWSPAPAIPSPAKR
jgi:hypothetical protein